MIIELYFCLYHQTFVKKNNEDLYMMYFGDRSLLYYAVVFAITAVIVGFLGFGGVAGALAEIARILFFVFILLFVLSLIAHIVRGGRG